MRRSQMPARTQPMQRTAMPARRTRLRWRSKKTTEVYRTQRVPLVRDLAAEPQICPVPWCTRLADSPHEPLSRARGGSITDPRNVVLVCHPHNEELTTEPQWGYDLGLIAHSWDDEGGRRAAPDGGAKS